MNLLKQNASLKNGYDFMFIIDKNYDNFIKKLEEFD